MTGSREGSDSGMIDSNPYDLTQDREENPIPQSEPASAEHPQQIGRYRVENVLGKGGFGLVYLAHDDQLQRLVAIKVPHARLVAKPRMPKPTSPKPAPSPTSITRTSFPSSTSAAPSSSLASSSPSTSTAPTWPRGSSSPA